MISTSFRLLRAVALACGPGLSALAGDGVVDLTALANYANQPVPAYITRDNTPANNPITDQGATLGRVLFYDKRLSRNDTISCASCHRQSLAFSDGATASTGVNGTTGRHSMRLVNARFSNEAKFFWDERATSLENQTTQPVQDHVEMGFSGTAGDPGFADLVTKLSAFSEYRVLFALTFGDPGITTTRVQRALAQFVRSIQSFDSRYDAGRALVPNDSGNFSNFSTQENQGKQLFLLARPAGAGCAGCHVPPEFSIDPNSRNNGVITKIGGGTDLTNTRAPSLRDLVGPSGASNGAFMHDASLGTLAAVIDHYNVITSDNAELDPRLRGQNGSLQDLNLSAQKKTNLAAFLATLTGSNVYTDKKWSDPFDDQGKLAWVVMAGESVAMRPNGDGTSTVSCKVVPGFQYQLQRSTNLSDWETVTTVTPNANGVCEQTVTWSGQVYYRYAFAVPES